MQEILIKSLLSQDFSSVSVNQPLSDALTLMTSEQHSCVLVTEEDHPVGIITERDVVRLMLSTSSNRELMHKQAREVMSSPIITLNEDETLFDALVVSRAERVRHLPIVDANDILVGIVTQTDLANAHFHIIEMQSEIIEKSIEAKTRDLRRANEELQALSMEDHLMEIGNRRAMEVDMDHKHAASVRYDRPYSLVLLDIDCFKLYNDFYGHAAGDDALRIAADYFKTNIRKSDRLYRYGGEELLLLLPETSAEAALELSKRLVQGLANLAHPHEKSPFGVLTTSAGIGCSKVGDNYFETWEEVVEYADKGLYAAKEDGRNRAHLASVEVPQGLKVVNY